MSVSAFVSQIKNIVSVHAFALIKRVRRKGHTISAALEPRLEASEVNQGEQGNLEVNVCVS